MIGSVYKLRGRRGEARRGGREGWWGRQRAREGAAGPGRLCPLALPPLLPAGHVPRRLWGTLPGGHRASSLRVCARSCQADYWRQKPVSGPRCRRDGLAAMPGDAGRRPRPPMGRARACGGFAPTPGPTCRSAVAHFQSLLLHQERPGEEGRGRAACCPRGTGPPPAAAALCLPSGGCMPADADPPAACSWQSHVCRHLCDRCDARAASEWMALPGTGPREAPSRRARRLHGASDASH